MKEKIIPLYLELKGRLSAAPPLGQNSTTRDKTLWEGLNTLVDKLNDITKEDYKDFRIRSEYNRNSGYGYIYISEYRTKLNGLIMRLHGEFFPKQPEPFSNQPTHILNQTQTQSQATQIQIIIDFQNLIDEKLYSNDLGEKEKGFFLKLKEHLSSVKSVVDVIKLIIKTAQDFGLDIGAVSKIFS